jgi:hypothetical protein
LLVSSSSEKMFTFSSVLTTVVFFTFKFIPSLSPLCLTHFISSAMSSLSQEELTCIYSMAYRTANLQMLHFKIFMQQMSILNILNMLHNLRFSLFKMPFIS